MSHYDNGYLGEQNLYGANASSAGISNGISHGGVLRFEGEQRQHEFQRHSNGRGGVRRGYHGGGGGRGGRGRGRGGYGQDAPRREQIDPEELNIRKTRDMLFQIGDYKEGADDFHPPSELFRLKEMIEEQGSNGGRSLEALLSAFRIMTTEQPHKTPLTAALLGFLTLSPQQIRRRAADAEDPESSLVGNGNDEIDISTNFGVIIIKHLVSCFRSDLDARLWRHVRFHLHLFAALIPLGIIKASTLRGVLYSFAAVLDEPGVAAARGDRAAMCITETLCRAGRDLIDDSSEERATSELDDLIGKIEKYVTEYRHVEIDLVRPVSLKHSTIEGEEVEEDFLHEESMETSLAGLKELKMRQYRRPAFLPSPLDLLPPPIVTLAGEEINADCIINLPDILVPPDDEYTTDDRDGNGIVNSTSVEEGGRHRNQQRAKQMEGWHRAGTGIERVPRYAKWFKETVPSSSTSAGIILHSILYDIIDLYQVNRKECARILFDSARWLRKGTFICKSTLPESGIFGEADTQWQIAEDGVVEGAWNLDELIVECILSTALVLPIPPQKPLYYTSLLREVVTLNPQSIAPALGKSVRRFYNLMNTGRVDGETIRRFAEWFSVHLSNFNFNWNWKEWIVDMHLPSSSPKLAFARRIVELEVRLAYFDRVKTTLPEEIRNRILPAGEATPTFVYGVEGHPYRERALKLIQSIRARATAEVILAELESFKKEISPEMIASFLPSTDDDQASPVVKVESAEQAEIVIRDILIQAVLSLGSRSFSHLLNVLEKYHPLLRQMTTSPLMRSVVLSSTARFWFKSPQWIYICVDKLLQYRLVEPTDVVNFVFAPQLMLPKVIAQEDEIAVVAFRDWSTFNWWELIKLTVNKLNGRVDQVQKRLDTLVRQELNEAEKKKAVREAGGEDGDSTMIDEGKKEEEAKNKVPLFPSGVTTSTLPRRPDLPPLPNEGSTAPLLPYIADEEKRGKVQTVEETRILHDIVSKDQRKVLIDVLQGFVTLLKPHAKDEQVWQREYQDSNDELQWQSWWLISWYREYCRLFHKFLAANHETIVANVFPSNSQDDHLYIIFDNACQMASE